MWHLVASIEGTKGEARIPKGDRPQKGARRHKNPSAQATSHGTQFYGEIAIRGL